jgi:hypothetical protein
MKRAKEFERSACPHKYCVFPQEINASLYLFSIPFALELILIWKIQGNFFRGAEK